MKEITRKPISVHTQQYKDLEELKLAYNYQSYSDLIRDLLVDAKAKLTIQVPEVKLPKSIDKVINHKTKLDIKAAKRAFYQKRMDEYWSNK